MCLVMVRLDHNARHLHSLLTMIQRTWWCIAMSPYSVSVLGVLSFIRKEKSLGDVSCIFTCHLTCIWLACRSNIYIHQSSLYFYSHLTCTQYVTSPHSSLYYQERRGSLASSGSLTDPQRWFLSVNDLQASITGGSWSINGLSPKPTKSGVACLWLLPGPN